MKTFLSILAYLISGFSVNAIASDFDCRPLQEVKWETLSDGVSWTKYDLEFTPYLKEKHVWENSKSRKVTVRAFKVDYSKNKLLFQSVGQPLKCEPSSERYIHQILSAHNAEVIGAINSNFFVMPSGGILGMAKDENKLWSGDLASLTISSSGVFAIENGFPFLDTKDQFMSRYGNIISIEDANRFSFAVQGYPKLVINHDLQISDGVMDSKRSRTSIGFAENQNEIILLTIDARGETSKTGMTLFEYAYFVKNEQCGVGQKTVLNLDGGGSSSFAIPALNIYEQADHCRNLGNILTIQKR
jgi:exopolysaccharide biosynthesis protein